MASRFSFNPNLPIPNNPFYSPLNPTLQGDYYRIVIGSGLALDPAAGVLSTTGGGGGSGTVTSIVAGTGLTGGTISTSGTIALDTTFVIQPTVLSAKGSLISATAASTPTALSVGTDGQVLTACATCTAGLTWAASVSPVARATASVTTTSIANGASDNVSITIPATYALLKIQTSHAAWVTLYTDTASRTSDASRTENTDPLPGTGVVAEVITSGAITQLISPGTIGFSSDGAGTSYARIKNKSGATAAITVTLTYVKLEG